jgi:hypothetical protein
MMTPERLNKLADFYIGHALVLELIAEIRRLWPVLEAARKLMSEEQPHPCPDYALRAMYRNTLRSALDSYDSAAAQHPGQLTLGGGEEGR